MSSDSDDKKTEGNTFLFSIDLEDVRDFIPDGKKYKDGVPSNTIKYLDWLDKINAKATFFIVGKTAREYPDLVREIIKKGHEPACHTDTHIHLTRQTEAEFKKDCESFLNTMANLGANTVRGFRAPTFSMVEQSKWAYKVLHDFGFRYSSSVLPSGNPIFGWPEFSGKGFYDGIYELPMNIGSWPFKVPFGGGVYFRFFPVFILRQLFKTTFQNNTPVLSYMHPYDVDTGQEHFMHPHINDSKALNWLMYLNRREVLERMEYLMKTLNAKIIRYDEYLKPKLENQ
jgi:polysaccharide deacetylase family protein (PEP-CTERM system associated)